MPSLLRRWCQEEDCGRFMGLRVALRPWLGWIGGVSHGICARCCWLRYGLPPERRSFRRGVGEAAVVVAGFLVLGLSAAFVFVDREPERVAVVEVGR